MLWIKWVEHLPLLLGPFGYSLASHPSSTMKGFLGICLLLALISPVATLTCVSYTGTTANYVDELEEKKCNFEDASCYSVFMDIPVIGGENIIAAKGCIPSFFCNAGDYTTTITKKFSAAGRIDCCQEDLCNKISQPLEPRKKMSDNGLTCPSCLSVFSDHCKGFFNTSCKGEEDQCFSIGGKAKVLGKVSARGCANKNICDQLKALVDLNLPNFLGHVTHVSCHPAENDEYDDEDDIVNDTPDHHVH